MEKSIAMATIMKAARMEGGWISSPDPEIHMLNPGPIVLIASQCDSCITFSIDSLRPGWRGRYPKGTTTTIINKNSKRKKNNNDYRTQIIIIWSNCG